MSVSFKAVLPKCELGEGPHWQPELNALVYVDISRGRVLRYYPATNTVKQLTVRSGASGDTVSFVLPVRGRPDLLIVGLGREIAALKWPDNAPDQSEAEALPLAAVQDGVDVRFNDAKCDPLGRIWAGTMGLASSTGVFPPNLAALFTVDDNMKPATVIDQVTVSNGLCWSADSTTFYYIDSMSFKVDAFDYDDETAAVDNRRTVIDYKKANLGKAIPDGMTIDADGNLWVANYFGHKLICVNPTTGSIVRTLEMPVPNLTSVCFGGPDYSTLFVTSATEGLSAEELTKAPESGALFVIAGLGVKGTPSVTAVLRQEIIKRIDAAFT